MAFLLDSLESRIHF